MLQSGNGMVNLSNRCIILHKSSQNYDIQPYMADILLAKGQKSTGVIRCDQTVHQKSLWKKGITWL